MSLSDLKPSKGILAWRLGAVSGPPHLSPEQRRALGAFLAALLFWALYLLSRTLTFAAIPSRNYPSYYQLLRAMDYIGLLSGLGMAFIYSWAWSWSRLWGGIWLDLQNLLAGSLAASSYLLHFFASYGVMSIQMDPQGALALLVVAFREEISFRGLFYESIKALRGRFWAEIFSSLLFVFNHPGFYKNDAYLYLFTFGILFSKMRSRQAPLGLLIAFHFFSDLFLIIQSAAGAAARDGQDPRWYWISLLVACLIVWSPKESVQKP
jgi:membrane protease YdiL (CAAX protease family)